MSFTLNAEQYIEGKNRQFLCGAIGTGGGRDRCVGTAFVLKPVYCTEP